MADELAKKLAEAKAKMFGSQPPSGSKIVLLVKGEVRVESSDPRVEVRKIET